ncbi:MAG: hypothetical protein IH947_11285 [Bacteroidetes bacterium]|nr:hypothetical protein [Bacteroidota bacterium]
MENPFKEIKEELTSIKNILLESKESKPKEKRIVGFKEFVKYSGWRPQTIYTKLHKGKVIPGAFKLPGSKFWFFDLNSWDRHLREAQENQYKEG